MTGQKTLLLLIGPKGAGKTYLAGRLESEAGVPFVRVEPIWLGLRNEGLLQGEAFDQEGQRRVLRELHRRLEGSLTVVLESTGTAPWFGSFVAELERLGRVMPIRVRVPLPICRERVRRRDQADHIPVSDARVDEVNAIAEHVTLPSAIEIENATEQDADWFIARFRAGAFN